MQVVAFVNLPTEYGQQRVQDLLAARRDPAEWRSGAGRELSATVVKSEQARRVGRATKSSGSLSGTPLLIF